MNKWLKWCKGIFPSIMLALVSLLAFDMVALASYSFYFPIYVTDTGLTNRAYVPVILTTGGTALQTAGYINASGNNTNMQQGTTNEKFMMDTTNITFIIPSLPSGGTVETDLYTGYSPQQTHFPIIVGRNGYWTTLDNAASEPADNFTWEAHGYLNTDNGTGKYLFQKNDTSANITALDTMVSKTTSQKLVSHIGNGYFLSYASASNQYASKNAAVVSPAGAQLSIDAWFYITSITGSYQTIVADGSGGSNTYWLLAVNPVGKLYLAVKDSAGAGAFATLWTSSDNIASASLLNTWQLATISYNDASTPKLNVYLNGSAISGTDTGTGGNIAQPNTYMSTGMEWSGAAFTFAFNGKSDEIRISSVARTLAEHQTAWDFIPFTVDANTTSLWHFNEGAGDPADAAGNNNLARAGGAAAPTWTAGGVATATVSATGIASGEKTGKAQIAKPFFGIDIAGTSEILPVTTNLTLNAPFWQTEESAAAFNSIDSTAFAMTSNAAYSATNGRVFTGSENITSPASASWNFPGDFTIETWAYITTALNKNLIKSVSSSDWATAAAGDWLVDVGLDAKTHLYVKGGVVLSSNAIIAINNWYHLVITRVGTALKVYVNGADQTEGSPTQAGAIGNTQALLMGKAQASLDGGLTGRMGETRIYKGTGLTATQVLQNYNTTRWKYQGLTDRMVYSTLASVPNNANNWIHNQQTVMPYVNSENLTVAGTQIWNYQPTTMLTGTTLPNNLLGGLYPATITWGANSNMTITFGTAVSSATPSSTAGATGGFSMPSSPMPTWWFASGNATANLPLYTWVNSIATEAGIQVQTLYFVGIISMALTGLVILSLKSHSVLIGLAGFTMILFLASNSSVIPFWIPYTVLVMDLCVLYLYRQMG